jgi:hypothetical protein
MARQQKSDRSAPRRAADAYGIRIYIITSFLTDAVIEITPLRENPACRARALHLSFWAGGPRGAAAPAWRAGWEQRAGAPLQTAPRLAFARGCACAARLFWHRACAAPVAPLRH